MAPRVPIPLREVVYTLSPYQQEIQLGAQKLPRKFVHFAQKNGIGLLIMTSVLMGPIWYADWYKEQEKLASRY